jgi:hypothetical protein
MTMMIPASDQAMKILDSYRRSRRVSREQALEELLTRAEETMSFEAQVEKVKSRNRGFSAALILKETQNAVNEVRTARKKSAV